MALRQLVHADRGSLVQRRFKSNAGKAPPKKASRGFPYFCPVMVARRLIQASVRQTMKTQPTSIPHPRPAWHTASILALVSTLALFLWACSLTPPDKTVTPGMTLSKSIAAPLKAGDAVIQGAPEIEARSAIVIDAETGETLFEKHPDAILPVASTQKLLTAMEVLASGDLESEAVVTLRDQLQPPTKIDLIAGTRYRRADLLAAMLVSSANDAASALASSAPGSYGDFIANMNRRAKMLGAKNSRFMNAHGLDAPGQHSTARDSAIIAYHAYRDPLIRHWAAQELLLFDHSNGHTLLLENTNQLLWHRPAYFNGLKSGFTLLGGKCLIASAKYEHREIIIVLLGSTQDAIFKDAKRLFRWQLKQDESSSPR